MENIKEFIKKEIEDSIKSSKVSELYRSPLVGFANAQNSLFNELKSIVHEGHALPEDILKGGKTVVSFFVPFTGEVVKNNAKYQETTRDWAEAKKDTEELINETIDKIRIKLNSLGIQASDNPGKGTFDTVRFIHKWSQRHVAYICGLGNFGINNMLITKIGCAGRYGSFIIDRAVKYDEVVKEEYCLYKRNKTCGACIKNCPVGALSYEGTDKAKCSSRLDYMADKYFDGIHIYSSCGKCICEPCATKNPTEKI